MEKPYLLLIVDDWELLERYEERFSKAFEVGCAPLGPEGVRMAQQRIPDLVLLDLTFENMTNEEARSALRSFPATRSIPIVAVGAQVQEPVTAEVLTKYLATFPTIS